MMADTSATVDAALAYVRLVAGLILTVLLGGAAYKAFFFFGEASKTQEHLKEAIDHAKRSFDTFADRVTTKLEDHSERIVSLETMADAEGRIERRQHRRRSTDRSGEE